TWIKKPWTRWIFASYGDDLSAKHSRDRRTILMSEWYQERWGKTVQFSEDQNVKTRYENTRRGMMLATSVSGRAIGEGADVIVIDDPSKPDEIESDTSRQTVITNFDQTFSTRLNDKAKGVIVVVMQRLHINDLAGHCLDLGYEHLCLPMEAE